MAFVSSSLPRVANLIALLCGIYVHKLRGSRLCEDQTTTNLLEKEVTDLRNSICKMVCMTPGVYDPGPWKAEAFSALAGV